MKQKKKMVTVTVTENGTETAHITGNNFFIVSNDRAFASSSCTLRDLLDFAVKIQACFFNNFMPYLMVGAKPGVTEEQIFNDIVEVAKAAVSNFKEV